MTPWIFILLSSGCSVLVAHLLRYIEFKKLDTLHVLMINYLIASIYAFTITDQAPDSIDLATLLPVFILAAFTGIFFIANYFVYSKSIYHNGVGISVASMRLSLIIPVLLSTFWYHEFLEAREWVGIFLVFMTLYLLFPDRTVNIRNRKFYASSLLILLFLFTGLGDSSLKIFEDDFSGFLTKEQFLGFVFLMAFLTGFSTLLIRRNLKFSWSETLLGAAVAFPNFYSALFLIDALSFLSGAIVYTAANLLTVIGATILGIWWWKDRLTKRQWVGLVLTLVSILLLI